MRSIRDAEVRGTRVLVRVDFNVPLDNGKVADDSRIKAAIPTIDLLRERGAAIVLMSHLGRPKGRVVPELSLEPVAARLSNLLGLDVEFVDDVAGEKATDAVRRLSPGQMVVVQNLRFDPGEEANNADFAAHLAALGDIYVNDAFGAAHRAHASTVAIARELPAYAGLLLQKEVEVLSTLLREPARPFVVVLGGAKVSDKFGVIENLLSTADTLLIGGGMANTFLLAQGLQIGTSLVEPDLVDAARQILATAAQEQTSIGLPRDVRIASSLNGSARIVNTNGLTTEDGIFDIGPETARAYADVIRQAGTIFWNGPMGVFERLQFSAGTRDVAAAVAEAAGISVVGGGDSIAALHQMGLAEEIDHLSTGGGASLEFMEGRDLPGIDAIPASDKLV